VLCYLGPSGDGCLGMLTRVPPGKPRPCPAVIPALLYAVTSLLTGWQVLQQVLWSAWGKPVLFLELVALGGAAVLLGGASIVLGVRRAGSITAAVGCLLLSAYYVPAVWATVQLASEPGHHLNRVILFPPLCLFITLLFAVLDAVTSPPRVDAHAGSQDDVAEGHRPPPA
jgi:hypothetical protein